MKSEQTFQMNKELHEQYSILMDNKEQYVCV